MRYTYAVLAMIFTVMLFSCQKEKVSNPIPPPAEESNVSSRHILLKDITIPHLPSPYYHFEYNKDSMVTKADFGSGFTMYDIIYHGNNIHDMRNNIFVNHDTLRYFYNTDGKVSVINFINEANVIYRHCTFTYQANLIKEMRWGHKDGNGKFPTDRIVTFTFFTDGNVSSIQDKRLSIAGVPLRTYLQKFKQYDKAINADDFSLIHDGIHDHLFLLQGFRLQKNNPAKETFSVDGIDFYTVDYTYVYNTDHTPSIKTGDLLYISGSDAGKRFETRSVYTYY